MRISYYKEGKLYTTSYDNKDISIVETMAENRTKVMITAKTDILLENAIYDFDCEHDQNDLFFINGYQSWTDSREKYIYEVERDIKKRTKVIVDRFAMDKYGDAIFYNYSLNKLHGYDVFYKKGISEVFVYNMNFDYAYLIVELVKTRKKLNLISDIKGQTVKNGDSFSVFDFYYFDSYEDGLASFSKSFPKLNREKLFGYTSWYNYYQNINENIILRDLDDLDERFELFQIDDGYETFVGDWLNVDKNKFPNGLKPIVDKVHSKGMKAGIWLAPFVAEEKSDVFQNHKDWFKKTIDGKLEKSGGNWSGFYSFDFDHEGVMEYIDKCLDYYISLGFDFFKLDFLYASALYDYEGRTRCIVQNKAYQYLSEKLKGKIILGCGAHMINGYRHFDYMRIGPDVSLEFDDVWYMRNFHRERISTKTTLQNTIYRYLFNDRFFGNDPDVFLLRDDNIKLNKEQKLSLATINALFGNILMTSDDIGTYDEEKKQLLDQTLNIFKNAKVLGYKRNRNTIEISYSLDDSTHTIYYNTSKGTLDND